jgi:hypothetical protein
MSFHLVDGIDFADRSSTAVAPSFLLGTNSAGLWVIRETTGRKAGLFQTREAAIRYARDESADGNFTIFYRPEGLEFETSHPHGLTAPGGSHARRR